MAEEISLEIVKYFGISYFNDAVKILKTPTALNRANCIINKINKLVNENNENINYSNFSDNNNNNKNGHKKNNYKNTTDQIGEISDDFSNNNNDINEFRLNNQNENNNNEYNIQYSNNYNYNSFQNNIFNSSNNEPRNQTFIFSSMNNIFTNNNSINSNFFQTENSSKISLILKQIYSSDINGKYQALINLQKLLNKSDNYLNQKNIEEILASFNTLLSTLTKNIRINQEDGLIQNIFENNQDIKLLKYLLDVYYYLSSQYKLMSIVNNEIIVYERYERLFILISEKSLISNQYAKKVIEILNSIIMNFLSNCNVSLSIISLIKIILNYKSNTDEYAQICSLAIKCLDKFRKFIFKLHEILDMNKIFECIYHFFSEYCRLFLD